MQSHKIPLNSPDNVYLNIDIANTNNTFFTDGAVGFPMRYTEERTEAILNNTSDYDVAVARFSIPIDGLPIILAPIQLGQTGINLTSWYVTLKYGSNYYQQALIHVPTQLGGTPVPPIVPSTQQIQDQYYFYYGYYQVDDFLKVLNTALATAFAALKAANLGIASTQPPIFLFNYQTQLFSFYVQNSYVADNITLFMNETLYYKLDAIDVNFYQAEPYPNCDYSFIIYERNQNQFVPQGYAAPIGSTGPTGTAPLYLQFSQNFVMTSSFPDLNDIVFTTSMPVLREQVSVGFNNINNSSKTTQSVLTDFTLTYDTSISRASVQYFPTVYRWISLQSNVPLTRVDLACFWRSSKGSLFPLYLPPNRIANIKLYFRKRVSRMLEGK